MRFKRVASIDVGFYALHLPAIAERVYFYLSARCSTRWHVTQAEIATVLRIKIDRVREAVEMLCDLHLIERWKFQRPKCAEYRVTLSTHPMWGIGAKRSYSIGPKRSYSITPNGAIEYPQTELSPITNSCETTVSGNDAALFAMLQKHFRKWSFNRKPIGRKFHFTRPMIGKAIECMRHLNQTMHTVEAFDGFLEGCGEYLALPRDVLTEGRDQRALSPVQWLNQWPEQVRLAGIYVDEKAEKVTRMPKAKVAS